MAALYAQEIVNSCCCCHCHILLLLCAVCVAVTKLFVFLAVALVEFIKKAHNSYNKDSGTDPYEIEQKRSKWGVGGSIATGAIAFVRQTIHYNVIWFKCYK